MTPGADLIEVRYSPRSEYQHQPDSPVRDTRKGWEEKHERREAGPISTIMPFGIKASGRPQKHLATFYSTGQE